MRVKGQCPRCSQPMGNICEPCQKLDRARWAKEKAEQCPVCQHRPCNHTDKELLRRAIKMAEEIGGTELDGEAVYDFVLVEILAAVTYARQVPRPVKPSRRPPERKREMIK